MPILVIVVPCYNEEEALPETARLLSEKLSQLVRERIISPGSALLFVDDGSSDATWALTEDLHRKNPQVFGGIKLSGNCGHQIALMRGLLAVRDYADITVSIDADLQDDIDAIDQMLACYLKGDAIVLGVRSCRETDSFFKRATAVLFYRFMRLLGANLVENHADFRLMNRESLNALAEHKESNIFLRGIVPSLGFKVGKVYYGRKKRLAGKSKYTVRKMLAFAFDGIFSAGIMGKITADIGARKRLPVYAIEKTLFKGMNNGAQQRL